MAKISDELAKQNDAKKDDGDKFVSKMKEGRERFLAHVIEHGLEIGRRTADDFIRHFPPTAIMNGLGNKAHLRSQILVLTTGIKQKIAMKKSAQSAGEDLQIALDEGETDCDSIVALFQPDDRVRYLDGKKLWAYIIEGEFWTVSATKRDDFECAKAHLAFMLERALEDKLVNHRDIVDGITVNELAIRLPKDKLGKIIQQALTSGQTKQPFTEVELLTAMPPTALVDYVSLEHIWEKVIVPRIAQAHGYVEDGGETVKEALNWLDSGGKAKDETAPKNEGAESANALLLDQVLPETPGGEVAAEEGKSDDDVEVTDDDIRIG
jgi:hypothetical protein